MKYRKKPIAIDAYQWNTKTSPKNYPDWFLNATKDGTIIPCKKDRETTYLKLKTLEGEYTSIPGDYIIKGIKGELYPCKPDIFEMTYEKVEE